MQPGTKYLPYLIKYDSWTAVPKVLPRNISCSVPEGQIYFPSQQFCKGEDYKNLEDEHVLCD